MAAIDHQFSAGDKVPMSLRSMPEGALDQDQRVASQRRKWVVPGLLLICVNKYGDYPLGLPMKPARSSYGERGLSKMLSTRANEGVLPW